MILIYSLNFVSNAFELQDTPPELDIEELKIKMTTEIKFQGKYFKDGMYGYHYQININNIVYGIENKISPNLINDCYKDVEVYFVFKQHQIDKNSGGKMRISFTRKPPESRSN